jgi:hypothetical protein
VLVEHVEEWAGEERVFVGRDGRIMRGNDPVICNAPAAPVTRTRERGGTLSTSTLPGSAAIGTLGSSDGVAS